MHTVISYQSIVQLAKHLVEHTPVVNVHLGSHLRHTLIEQSMKYLATMANDYRLIQLVMD